MDRIIEEESGTYMPPRVHPHNGYYAGDSPRSRSGSPTCASLSRPPEE